MILFRFRYPRLPVRLRTLALSLLAFVLLLTLAWNYRAPLLHGAATAWMVDEPLQAADAIVVLGGGIETRTFAAVRLLKEGLANTILIFDTEPSPTERLGLSLNHAQSLRDLLVRIGAPSNSIHVIGHNITSTRDEAFAVREWLIASGAKRVLVPTEFPSSRRTRWIFTKALEGTQGRAAIHATDSWNYERTNWWQKEQGLIALQNEVIKMLYYRLKY